MIGSWAQCRDWIAADLARYSGGPITTLLVEPQTRWLVKLRLTEWWCNTRGGPLAALFRWRLAQAGLRYGYTIPVNVLGRGTRLPHAGTIVISGKAAVGRNCQILHNVTLADHRGAPMVGDDVFVSVGAILVGPITVGDRAWIGAGAVVTRDVPPGETWVGNPARSVPGQAIQA